MAPPPRLPFRHWQQQGRIPYAIEASQFAAAYRRVYQQEPPRCPYRKQTRCYGAWELESLLGDCRHQHQRSLEADWAPGGRMRAALLEAIPGPRYRQILERHATFHPSCNWADPWWPLDRLAVKVPPRWDQIAMEGSWRVAMTMRTLGLGLASRCWFVTAALEAVR